MKTLTTLLIAFILFLSSCSKDCSNCRVVVDSDRKKQCGFANNGWDVESTTQLGELCGDDVDAAKSENNKTYSGTTFCSNATVTYTIRARVLCD